MSDIDTSIFTEKTLQGCLEYGVGIIHDGMTEREIHQMRTLYRTGVIRVLIVSHQFCWQVSDLESHIVVVMDA